MSTQLKTSYEPTDHLSDYFMEVHFPAEFVGTVCASVFFPSSTLDSEASRRKYV
jgi:hypothetical protein